MILKVHRRLRTNSLVERNFDEEDGSEIKGFPSAVEHKLLAKDELDLEHLFESFDNYYCTSYLHIASVSSKNSLF